MSEEVRKYFAALGSATKGKTTDRKSAACRLNVAKAREAKRLKRLSLEGKPCRTD